MSQACSTEQAYKPTALNECRLTVLLFTDSGVDDEWLCSFPPAERELVKEHLFNSIQSHPSSQAACLAVATVLQLRLLPPEDVEEKRRIVEQGKRHFELAMEKMVGAPVETQIVVLMDSMLHQVSSFLLFALPFFTDLARLSQTEHAGPAAGYAIQSLIDTILSACPSFSHFYTAIPRRRPRPFLPSGVSQLNFLLRGLSCMDALRALSLGDRRTFFDLSTTISLSGEEESPLKDFDLVPGALVRASDEFFGGVAPFLVFKAAEVCEVAADAREGVIGAIELRRRAEGMEREMREWSGSAVKVLLQVQQEEEKCEKRRVEVERTREMWRQVRHLDFQSSPPRGAPSSFLTPFDPLTGSPYLHPPDAPPPRSSSSLQPHLPLPHHLSRLAPLGSLLPLRPRSYHYLEAVALQIHSKIYGQHAAYHRAGTAMVLCCYGRRLGGGSRGHFRGAQEEDAAVSSLVLMHLEPQLTRLYVTDMAEETCPWSRGFGRGWTARDGLLTGGRC